MPPILGDSRLLGKQGVEKPIVLRRGCCVDSNWQQVPRRLQAPGIGMALQEFQRLARAFDRPDDPHEQVMARLLTPVAKFWVCKRGSHFAQEAMECLGGNGYVEEGGEGIMARIYREMPLNSIWEGAGNIMALDLLRALRKADAAAALAQELAPAKGMHPALDRLAAQLPLRVEEMATEMEARRLAQDVALAVQAALLARTAPLAVFAAFCDSRIGGHWGHSFGSLNAATAFDAIIDRARPH